MIVLPPDIEGFLAGYLRYHLGDAGGTPIQVGVREPDGWTSGQLVVIRDDGGPQDSDITFTRSVGVSVLAGTRGDRRPANRLARVVYAILTDNWGLVAYPGSPVTMVDLETCSSPYVVPEDHDTTRYHMTLTYRLVGVITTTAGLPAQP